MQTRPPWERLLVASALAVALLAAQPSHAGWEYADWNMTPEQVVEASQGKAKAVPPAKKKHGLIEEVVANHAAGALSFQVSFLFRISDSKKMLDRVVLTLVNTASGAQLYRDLVAIYDRPLTDEISVIEGGDSHIAKWEDAAKNNRITYYGIGSYYAVDYRPLKPGADGL